MDTMQVILSRRSVRRYKDQAIPADDLKQIMEATHQAPSAANRQPWHFVVVTDAEQKEHVAQACNGQMWMADAGAIVVALGVPKVSEKWYRVDVAIALENLVLAAWSLGYGTCWIGAFDPAKVKQVCGIPADLDVVACTPLGVPEIAPAARDRKPWDEVFSINSYGEHA
jgi:nitroreductase